MADITMCYNHDCLSKEKCYRYTAIPNTFKQSYIEFKVPKDRKKCGNFINNKKKINKL